MLKLTPNSLLAKLFQALLAVSYVGLVRYYLITPDLFAVSDVGLVPHYLTTQDLLYGNFSPGIICDVLSMPVILVLLLFLVNIAFLGHSFLRLGVFTSLAFFIYYYIYNPTGHSIKLLADLLRYPSHLIITLFLVMFPVLVGWFLQSRLVTRAIHAPPIDKSTIAQISYSSPLNKKIFRYTEILVMIFLATGWVLFLITTAVKLRTYLLVALVPIGMWLYARTRMPHHTLAISGAALGFVAYPFGRGLFTAMDLPFPFQLLGIPGLILEGIHGWPGYIVFHYLNIDINKATDTEEIFSYFLNGIVWAVVYGYVGHILDRLRLKVYSGG